MSEPMDNQPTYAQLEDCCADLRRQLAEAQEIAENWRVSFANMNSMALQMQAQLEKARGIANVMEQSLYTGNGWYLQLVMLKAALSEQPEGERP